MSQPLCYGCDVTRGAVGENIDWFWVIKWATILLTSWTTSPSIIRFWRLIRIPLHFYFNCTYHFLAPNYKNIFGNLCQTTEAEHGLLISQNNLWIFHEIANLFWNSQVCLCRLRAVFGRHSTRLGRVLTYIQNFNTRLNPAERCVRGNQLFHPSNWVWKLPFSPSSETRVLS